MDRLNQIFRFYALVACLFTSSDYGIAQIQLIVSPLYGVTHSKADLTRIQNSYSSYLRFLDTNFPNDAYTASENWDSQSVDDIFGAQVGISGENLYTSISYFRFNYEQERSVLRESGYGRTFVWKEYRNEILLDLGYGSKYFDVFGSFGMNANNYRMVSYQVYPSGAASLTNEFNFNGLFKQFDAGMTYGFGIKVKPIKHVAFDVRYLFARDNIIGEKNQLVEDNLTLTDNSWARTPGTADLPADYTQPLSYTNSIVPNFKRNYLIFTALFYFNN